MKQKTYKPKIRLYLQDRLTSNGIIELEKAQAHYLFNVMRKRNSDEILVFNADCGEYLAQISNINKKICQVQILNQTKQHVAVNDLWLCFAPVKNAPIANLVQKATELGVAKLKPVFTQRTVIRSVNVERLEANAIEASEQCLRTDVPEVCEPITLEQMISNWDNSRKLIICDETGGGLSIKKQLENIGNVPVAFLIGPEGGFSEEDFLLFNDKDFVVKVGMGKRILRADTAAISALTCYQTIIGDWNE